MPLPPKAAILTAAGLLTCLIPMPAAAVHPPSQNQTPAQHADYEDVRADSVAAEHITTLASMGVLDGTDCHPGRFCPHDALPRWVMAVWLTRIIDGRDPPQQASRFADVDGDPWWQGHVERLAELRVTLGCATEPQPRFCPDGHVTRAQMAAFLVRAFKLPPGEDADFTDVASDDAFHSDINALAASGLTVGCSSDPPRYCPQDSVTRVHMAIFLNRAVGLARDRDRPAVVVESSAPRLVQGDFDVTITFEAPVAAFDASAIQVVNGEVASLTGHGILYHATIRPAAPGSVMVRVPPGTVHDDGRSGRASDPLARISIRSVGDTRNRPGFDTWDRSVVAQSARSEFSRTEPGWGFTGDVADCEAGTTSQDFRDSVIRRVNWYREMAGLDTVTENPVFSAGAQQTALMMLAEGKLSHTPAPGWACHTGTGADYAGGNLAIGSAGIASIDRYMQDSGAHNLEVGHRRWILYPHSREMGTGDVSDPDSAYRMANSLWPQDGNLWADRPGVREERGFVSWPPSGYVPANAVWGTLVVRVAGL